jgi:hypothetical protein
MRISSLVDHKLATIYTQSGPRSRMFYAYIVAVVIRFPSIAFTHVLAHFISFVMYRRYPVVRHHFIFSGSRRVS